MFKPNARRAVQAVLISALAGASFGVLAAESQVSESAPAVVTRANDPASFRVFVDLPTGYMFVSTPKGWLFRGTLPSERYAELPAGTYVSLVPPAQVSAPELLASAPAAATSGATEEATGGGAF